MKTVNKNEVKIRRMVSSDITPTPGILWANIPEKEMVADQYFSDVGFCESNIINYDKPCHSQ